MPENRMEKLDTKKLVICLLLAAFALVSALWLADAASSPEHHSASIAALDEKKTTVMELTAAAAAASVIISAVPGDATTPIADQVAEMGSWLLIVTGVLMLEKFLLTFTGYAAFGILIPVACAFGILHQVAPRALFKGLAIRLALLGAVLFAVIPFSLHVSELFEETFAFRQTVQKAEQTPETLEGDAEEDEETGAGGIADWFAGLGDTITSGVNDAVERAEAALSDFIDAVAVLLISNCVIPVLVLMLMLWVLKLAVSLPIGPMDGGPRPPALPEHKAIKPQSPQS